MTTKFIVKNDEENINKFKTYIENNRIHYPSVLEGDDNDELEEVIDQLESANNPESEFYGGYFGVTYDVNREAKDDTGHFYLDYIGGTEIYHDERVYDPNVKKFPENINTENYPTPPQSPRKKGGKRRKKKTRKKRGGAGEVSVGTNWISKYAGLDPQEEVSVYKVLKTENNNIMFASYMNNRVRTLPENEFLERFQLFGENPGGDEVPPKMPGGRRRKKKTRKKRKRRKRGGMDSQPPTPEWRPGQPPLTPPGNLPEFMLPPIANTVTRRNRSEAIERERAPPGMRRSDDVVANDVNRANERYRRSQRSYLRNLTGDLLERCSGSRCGLGGRRRKKTRKKKNRKRRTKKKSRKHKRRK